MPVKEFFKTCFYECKNRPESHFGPILKISNTVSRALKDISFVLIVFIAAEYMYPC